MAGFETTAACPHCRQQLVVPTYNLSARFTCPRCFSSFPATALVALDTAVPALPTAPRAVIAASPSNHDQATAVAASAVRTAATDGPSEPAQSIAVSMPMLTPERPMRAEDNASSAAPAIASAPGVSVAERRAGPDARTSGPALGIVAAEYTASYAAGVAARIDARLYGKRSVVVGSAAAIVLVTSRLSPLAYAVALPTFATLVYLLLIARIWSLRDEDGNWTGTGVLRRMRATAASALQALDVRGVSGFEVARRASTPLVSAGLVACVVAPPLQLLWNSVLGVTGASASSAIIAALDTLQSAGVVSVLVGFLLWLTWYLHVRRSALGKSFRTSSAAVVHDGVPAVLDVWHMEENALTAVRHEGLRKLLEALKSWRPRRCHYEDDYQQSLLRHLQKVLDGAVIRDRKPLWKQGNLIGYPDIWISDSVLIELKRELSAGEADRALGQVWKYADAWRAGPVLLVLCETATNFENGHTPRHVAELRARGYPVLCVAAGRRLRS